MKLYKRSTDDEYVYLKNRKIYDSNIGTYWYLEYFTFYFPIESYYNKNNCAQTYTANKKIMIKTEKQLLVFMRRFQKELNEIL